MLLHVLREDFEPRLLAAVTEALGRIVHVDIPDQALDVLRTAEDPWRSFYAAHVLAAHRDRRAIPLLLERGLVETPVVNAMYGLPRPHSFGEILWQLGQLPPYRTPPSRGPRVAGTTRKVKPRSARR